MVRNVFQHVHGVDEVGARLRQFVEIRHGTQPAKLQLVPQVGITFDAGDRHSPAHHRACQGPDAGAEVDDVRRLRRGLLDGIDQKGVVVGGVFEEMQLMLARIGCRPGAHASSPERSWWWRRRSRPSRDRSTGRARAGRRCVSWPVG